MDKAVKWDKDTKTVNLTREGLVVTDADTFGKQKEKETVTDVDDFDDKDKHKDNVKDKTKDIGREKLKTLY